ncbi:MAG: TlpA family protein disulfide reductase [Dehalococcoidia bacterium]
MASRISKRPLIIVIAVVIAVLAVVGIALSCSSFSPSQAPDFTLPTLTGDNITLSELEGTPLVLNFWTTTCSYCVQQLHYLEAVARQTAGEIKVIAINIGQSASTVQKFFGDYEPVMIIALDTNRETFASYCQQYDNAKGFIPFTLVLDGEGIVRYAKIGAFSNEAELRDTLEDVLGRTIPETS